MYKFPDNQTIADYHVYSLEWEPGLLRWLVDGNVYYETSQWWSLGAGESEPYAYPAPYDKPFYILLNLALGGNYDSGVSPEASSLPARMFVDYVRVYDKDQPYATNVKRPTPQRDEKASKTLKLQTDETLSLIQASKMPYTMQEIFLLLLTKTWM